MATPLVGLDYTYLYKQETTFGTALTSGMTQLATEEMPIDHDIKSHLISRATGLRGSIEDDNWQDQVGSVPKTSVSFYVTRGTLDILPAVLQKHPAYAAAANVMTYQTYNYSNMPDFAASSGYFYSLVANAPVAGYDESITSAVGTSMTLSCAPDANEGALYCKIDFVGKTSTTGATIVPTGTTSLPVMTQLYKNDNIQKVLYGATDITAAFEKFEVTVNGNVKAIPSGPAKNYAITKWEVTGSITCNAADTGVRALMALAKSNTPDNAALLVIDFGQTTGTPAAADDMVINMQCNFTGFTLDKSEEEKVTLDFVGLFNSDGTIPPFQLKWYNA